MGGTFNNMSSLVASVKRDISKAVNLIDVKGEAALHENTWAYYTSQPDKYIRTGALGNTPRSSGVTSSGNTWELELYLDDSYRYSTGTWDMKTVLDAANNGALVGSGGFWEQSKEDIERIVNETLSQFFRG
ncbi:MAG: hypothetical protein PHW34_07755 [Hespellia sp.]|nr:hypothetical protein [Hespellia sp.]